MNNQGEVEGASITVAYELCQKIQTKRPLWLRPLCALSCHICRTITHNNRTYMNHAATICPKVLAEHEISASQADFQAGP
jgi:hypothetical protein